MASLDTPGMSGQAKLYSPLISKYVKLIKHNEMIKHLVFQTFDDACERQYKQFIELFDNMLTSTFANPWVFLKGATAGVKYGDGDASLADVEQRIPKEIQGRTGIEAMLSKWLQDIPTESHQIDEAVDKVQMLVLKTYGFIRSQVCDQVELFAESFFKLPLMRHLEADMAGIDLSEADKKNYADRRERLNADVQSAKSALVEINDCLERMTTFKLQCDAKSSMV